MTYDTDAYAEMSDEEFNERLTAKIEEMSDEEFNERLTAKIEENGKDVVRDILADHFRDEILDDYADKNSHYREYADVVAEFEEDVLPDIVQRYGAADMAAVDEAWNNWTDGLHKDDEISDWAYSNWTYSYGRRRAE